MTHGGLILEYIRECYIGREVEAVNYLRGIIAERIPLGRQAEAYRCVDALEQNIKFDITIRLARRGL